MDIISFINWGDFPTWLAAIGAIGAFIVYYQLLQHELSKTDTAHRTYAYKKGLDIYIENKGDFPIYDLLLSTYTIKHHIGNIGPSDKHTHTIPLIDMLPNPEAPLNFSIEFTDINGIRWKRDSNGKLTKQKTRQYKPI